VKHGTEILSKWDRRKGGPGGYVVPQWSLPKAAVVGFWTARGWSAGEIAREFSDGTTSNAVRHKWREWLSPYFKPNPRHTLPVVLVSITQTQRKRLAKLAAARNVAPEEWLRRIALAAIDDDLFEALGADEIAPLPSAPIEPAESVEPEEIVVTIAAETRHPGDFIRREGAFGLSRDLVTIAGGSGQLGVGTVLGRVPDLTTATATITDVPGAGKGTITLADPPLTDAMVRGRYTLTITKAAGGGGSFQIEDPAGVVVGEGVVGAPFAGPVNFTLAAGGTDFVVGDQSFITVGVVTWRYAPASADGPGSIASAILIGSVDTTDGDVKSPILSRSATVSAAGLVFDESVNTDELVAEKIAQLGAVGILVK
jgi:hypothetical protein